MPEFFFSETTIILIRIKAGLGLVACSRHIYLDKYKEYKAFRIQRWKKFKKKIKERKKRGKRKDG